MTSSRHILSVLLLIVGLSSWALLSCSHKEDLDVKDPEFLDEPAVIILTTDSDEWQVKLFKEHLLYKDAIALTLPEPWTLPTREEAGVLRHYTFGEGEERYCCSENRTFGMPSTSVTQAGAKTKYSLLGIYRRKTVIMIQF